MRLLSNSGVAGRVEVLRAAITSGSRVGVLVRAREQPSAHPDGATGRIADREDDAVPEPIHRAPAAGRGEADLGQLLGTDVAALDQPVRHQVPARGRVAEPERLDRLVR